jgi:hypothetical protein
LEWSVDKVYGQWNRQASVMAHGQRTHVGEQVTEPSEPSDGITWTVNGRNNRPSNSSFTPLSWLCHQRPIFLISFYWLAGTGVLRDSPEYAEWEVWEQKMAEGGHAGRLPMLYAPHPIGRHLSKLQSVRPKHDKTVTLLRP